MGDSRIAALEKDLVSAKAAGESAAASDQQELELRSKVSELEHKSESAQQTAEAEIRELRQRLRIAKAEAGLQQGLVTAESIDVLHFLARARSPEWDVIRVAGDLPLANAESRDKVQLS